MTFNEWFIKKIEKQLQEADPEVKTNFLWILKFGPEQMLENILAHLDEWSIQYMFQTGKAPIVDSRLTP
jgi:hypothetical protein